jgi:hypothetical protein
MDTVKKRTARSGGPFGEALFLDGHAAEVGHCPAVFLATFNCFVVGNRLG